MTDFKAILKLKIKYFICFLALLLIEIFIGVFVNDSFIRPYLGDVLVTAMLCCFMRIFVVKWKQLPFAVFGFAAGVEVLQLFEIDRLLGIEGSVLVVIVGATFDFADILCYSVGCLLFFGAEQAFLKLKSNS